MRTEDLYLKYAQVINMCEGTKLKPFECVKRHGNQDSEIWLELTESPSFSDKLTYSFAVAILEDRPVFVGDKVYDKYGYAQIVVDAGQLGKVIWKDYTWNPPKNTFNLNGEELPCPTKISDNPLSSAFLIGGQAYHFSNWGDCLKVQEALHKLLQDASK